MVSRVSVGDGKFCYSGPSCKLHGAHWSKDLKSKLVEAENNFKNAKSFDEFTEAKKDLGEAENNYYATEKGLKELKRNLSHATRTKDALGAAEIRSKIVTAEKLLKENNAKAAANFLKEQTSEEKAAEVFITADKEKLALYLEDSDPKVLANLALNPNTSAAALTTLTEKGDPTTQMYVLINKNTGIPTLKSAVKHAKNNAVKDLAAARLKQVQAEKDAEDVKREKELKVQAVRYTSYSYGGKGGGK